MVPVPPLNLSVESNGVCPENLSAYLRFLRWIEWKFQDFKIRKAIESWTEDLDRINVNIQVYYLFCTPIG